ncbi:MAG: septation protein SpoVG family protein [Fibrobacteria bacterium]|nr:septation protein SpoVG family protein [Fibrobacteria bacterium]
MAGINGLEITDVIVFPIKNPNGSSLRSFIRLVLNNSFIISGIKVHFGRKGHFVTFPQEIKKDQGKRYDVCFPITTEMREYISKAVLQQYALTVDAPAKAAA